MATLNTVRAVLKDVRMREQAGNIQKNVGMLLDDVTQKAALRACREPEAAFRADGRGSAEDRHLNDVDRAPRRTNPG